MSKPTFKQILDAHKRQVLVGKAYLGIAKGLLQADPAILHTAPTFFAITTDGSLELAQMALARLYDRTKRAVTIHVMLAQARRQSSSFQRGDVIAAITKSERTVHRLEPVLTAIRKRRNEWFAHLDSRTVTDPKALAARAKVTIPDLDLAFKGTEDVVREMSSLYEGVIGKLEFLGGDDYKAALDWIRSAKCTFIENFEKEFKTPWTGPRPKNCSANLLHMT